MCGAVQMTTEETNKIVGQLQNHVLSDKLTKWLSAPDASTTYNRAIQQRYPGTGVWFQTSKTFEDWRVGKNTFLWLHGLVGCGKTVLSSTIIEHLKEEPHSLHTNLLYFFFDFNDKDKQSHEEMIRTFVQQMYSQDERSRQPLDQLFEQCAVRGEQPTITSLEDTFATMLAQAADTEVVVDALDESCQQRETIEWFQRVSTINKVAPHKLKIIVTSRREYGIESSFLKWLSNENVLPIEEKVVDRDISHFIHNQIRLDLRLERWRGHPDVQDEIESKLAQKSHGMQVKLDSRLETQLTLC
jgi:hypothetical protein